LNLLATGVATGMTALAGTLQRQPRYAALLQLNGGYSQGVCDATGLNH
jgi:hypothetical protein